MRRILCSAIVLLAATASWAGTSFYLDRDGVLWTARAEQRGLVLTGTREGNLVIESTVPFPVGIAGSIDRYIQVVADEVTGKVVVVWERQWSESTSEIMAAVWSGDGWEQVLRLTDDLSMRPRFPVVALTRVASTVADGDDTETATTIADSFAHIMWWEGDGEHQHATYALLTLDTQPNDNDRLLVRDLDSLTPVGLSCDIAPSESILEHPLFADSGDASVARILFGSSDACLFYLADVSFVLEPPPTPDDENDSIVVVAQRRRHRPVFGVRRAFPITRELDFDSARVVVGTDLSPVIYRVANHQLEYVVATPQGWSERRTLATDTDLTLDQAIPLVENLAR